MLVDSAALLAQGEELGGRMRDIEGRAYTLAGEQFNLASPKQIAAVLFGTVLKAASWSRRSPCVCKGFTQLAQSLCDGAMGPTVLP